MIDRISGKLIEKTPTYCVVDCQGVGYGLHISLNTFQQLEKYPENAFVPMYTYLHVREDALQLFGFYEVAERVMFQMLISISGIGPRIAIAVLSGSSPAELRAAIAREDVGMLTRIPGVGRKTAQRLILELKEKIQKQKDIEQLAAISVVSQEQRSKVNEAILALTSLGYKQQEAQAAVDKVVRRLGDEISLEEMIKEAFKEV